jgi:hypothetical protein
MLKDCQELEVSTSSHEAVGAIDSFFEQLLSVGNDTQVILKAVDADPTCVLANAYIMTSYQMPLNAARVVV